MCNLLCLCSSVLTKSIQCCSFCPLDQSYQLTKDRATIKQSTLLEYSRWMISYLGLTFWIGILWVIGSNCVENSCWTKRLMVWLKERKEEMSIWWFDKAPFANRPVLSNHRQRQYWTLSNLVILKRITIKNTRINDVWRLEHYRVWCCECGLW